MFQPVFLGCVSASIHENEQSTSLTSHRGKGFCDRLDAYILPAENTQGELPFALLFHRMGHDIVRVPGAYPEAEKSAYRYERLGLLVRWEKSQYYQCKRLPSENQGCMKAVVILVVRWYPASAARYPRFTDIILPWVELDTSSGDFSLATAACKNTVVRFCNDIFLFLLPYPVRC